MAATAGQSAGDPSSAPFFFVAGSERCTSDRKFRIDALYALILRASWQDHPLRCRGGLYRCRIVHTDRRGERRVLGWGGSLSNVLRYTKGLLESTTL